MNIIERYEIISEQIPVQVKIIKVEKESVMKYLIEFPEVEKGTEAVLTKIQEEMIKILRFEQKEITDIRASEKIKIKYRETILSLIKKYFPSIEESRQILLMGYLMHKTIGLGDIEFLINDPFLEEVVIHGEKYPTWVYHRKHGWLKTNMFMSEEAVYNYSASIARQVGKQISVLNPLLDAHITTGDRVNAILYPVSSMGNTITIRKFRKNPWTIPELIDNNTISSDIIAFLWLMIQYEMSIIISGGTASGKSTFLNSLMCFLQPNHRVISIEDTRELYLPSYVYWTPLVTRTPNVEGKGEVSMLDLLINSLRMRPDRIIVGEIRRKMEAETLFEAIHTGHAVYATLHADTAIQTINRLINPPIELPKSSVEALGLIVTMIRDRRKGIRRSFEVAEVMPIQKSEGEIEIKANVLWRWKPKSDTQSKQAESYRVINTIKMHTGMNELEIKEDLANKKKIIDWMVKEKIFDIEEVGRITSSYYEEQKKILGFIDAGFDKKKVMEEI